MGDNGSANYTSQDSDYYYFVLAATDHTLGSSIERQGMSFAAVEVPTRDEPTKVQGFWPFGPTSEPVASFDPSEWFIVSGGANSEETEGSTFEIKEGPVQRLGLWSHIINTLTTLARALVMAVLLHYVWPTFGSSLYNQVASTNTNERPEIFGGFTTAEDGLALAARPAAKTWNRGNKRSVGVMMDNRASGYLFDDCRRLRYKLESYQVLAIRRWITTAGECQKKGAGQGLLRGHSIGAQGLKRRTQLSVMTAPDVERTSFRLSKMVPYPGESR